MKSIIATVFVALKLRTLLLLGTVLAGTAGGALAGEDSTERWHGVGPAFYEVNGGLKRFAEGDPSEPPLTRRRESKQGSGR